MTAFYGVLDLDTGEFTYANAGHNPPILAARGGTLTDLADDRRRRAWASCPGSPMPKDRVTLAAGDTLLLYTDGISEAMDRDGHEFTEARLMRSLSEAHRKSVEIVHDVADGRGASLRRRCARSRTTSPA